MSFHILEGVYPDILPAVRTGDLDLAICLVPGRPRDESLNFVSLVKDRLVPAVRADHPVLGRRNLRLADSIGLDWIIYRRSHTGLDIFEQTFIANRLEPPKSTIECTSFACALALVENGDYVTLVPSQKFSPATAGHRRLPRCCSIRPCSPGRSWRFRAPSRSCRRFAWHFSPNCRKPRPRSTYRRRPAGGAAARLNGWRSIFSITLPANCINKR